MDPIRWHFVLIDMIYQLYIFSMMMISNTLNQEIENDITISLRILVSFIF